MPQGQAIACPNCGKVNDGHTSPTDPDATPGDGDISMCLYCGYLGIYVVTDSTLSLRSPTAEESIELANNLKVQMVEQGRLRIMGD